MKKAYSAPNIYAEDLLIAPFITAGCEEVEDVFDYGTDHLVNDEDCPITLLHATSWDCIGWGSNGAEEGWGFHIKSPGWDQICSRGRIFDHLPEGADPGDVWLTGLTCQNIPIFELKSYWNFNQS